MIFPRKEQVEKVREQYPEGSRVELVHMIDDQAPPTGCHGTVMGVDDTGTILVKWDNGSTLGIVFGSDICRKVVYGGDSFRRYS